MRQWVGAVALWAACAVGVGPVWAQGKPVYRCPGNLYTDALSPKEAIDKGCKTLDGAPITIIQSQMPRSAPAARPTGGASGGERVASQEQRARDLDARRILEAELQKAQDELDALRKEYNNGQPERRGDERNAQKYLDRIEELKNAIARKEADVASVRSELGKLAPSASSSGSGAGAGSGSRAGSTAGDVN